MARSPQLNVRGSADTGEPIGGFSSPLVSRASSAWLRWTRALALPPVVDQLTVKNHSQYSLTIAITTDAHDDWTLVGTVRWGTTETFSDVVDQGDMWVFRFAAQGKVGGELRVPREQLEEAGWQLEVPPRIAAKLESLGAPFSP